MSLGAHLRAQFELVECANLAEQRANVPVWVRDSLHLRLFGHSGHPPRTSHMYITVYINILFWAVHVLFCSVRAECQAAHDTIRVCQGTGSTEMSTIYSLMQRTMEAASCNASSSSHQRRQRESCEEKYNAETVPSVSWPCCEQHADTGVCDGLSTPALGPQMAPCIFV